MRVEPFPTERWKELYLQLGDVARIPPTVCSLIRRRTPAKWFRRPIPNLTQMVGKKGKGGNKCRV